MAALALAAALFAFAFADGGYGTTTRGYASLAVWWLVGFGAAVGLRTARHALPPLARASLLAFGGFALWTLMSVAWSSDAESTYRSFARVLLYVGVLVLAAAAPRAVRRTALVWAVYAAIVAVDVVAMISRLFPHALGGSQNATLASIAASRLSYPVGYWNGLAILAALSLPLAVGLAATATSPLARVAPAGPTPLVGGIVYLASSRGAIFTAVVGLVAVAAGMRRRWTAAGAAAVAAIGAAAGAGVVIHARHGAAHLTAAHGFTPALELVVVCVLAGLGWELVRALGSRASRPAPALGWALAAVTALAVLVAAALAHPVARFEAFKRLPASGGGRHHHSQDYIRAHLLSTSGSGRWQFWHAAVSEFRAHPFAGGGAGSFERWWSAHRPISLFVVDVHSVYLQALAELGIVGFLLIVAAFALGIAAAYREAYSDRRSDELGPALAAAFVAFACAAGIDWMWELPGVCVFGLAALGLAFGPGIPLGRSRATALTPARAGMSVLAAAGMIAALIPLVTALHLRSSQQAFTAGKLDKARSSALQAHALEPWASSPLTQLSLIAERRGDPVAAAQWIDRAIEQSPDDWRLHLIAARIDTERLRVAQARRQLRLVRRLNPRLALS